MLTIALHNRFEILYKAINDEKNSNLDVLGSNAYFVDDIGKIIGKSLMPIESSEFEKNIYNRNPFIHSSVIIKKSFLIENNFYDENLLKAQDYDLWLRGFKKNNFKNLEDR